jgi:hypothetical protein
METFLKSFIRVALLGLLWATPGLAQKLVDPSKVAQKRRTEQIRQRDCAKKADTEKVMPRERTAFLLHCLEAADAVEDSR